MTNPDFQARLARLQQNRTSQSTGTGAGKPTPPRTYRDRLDRALATAAAAGISRDAGFPPAMRALSAMGIPVRPLHFKSAASLFLSGTLLGLLIFGGVLWFVSSPHITPPSRGPVAGLISLGWNGVYAISVAMGVAFMLVIKAQAARARLPRWQDL